MYIPCFLIDFANSSSISSQIVMKVSRFISLPFIWLGFLFPNLNQLPNQQPPYLPFFLKQHFWFFSMHFTPFFLVGVTCTTFVITNPNMFLFGNICLSISFNFWLTKIKFEPWSIGWKTYKIWMLGKSYILELMLR